MASQRNVNPGSKRHRLPSPCVVALRFGLWGFTRSGLGLKKRICPRRPPHPQQAAGRQGQAPGLFIVSIFSVGLPSALLHACVLCPGVRYLFASVGCLFNKTETVGCRGGGLYVYNVQLPAEPHRRRLPARLDFRNQSAPATAPLTATRNPSAPHGPSRRKLSRSAAWRAQPRHPGGEPTPRAHSA